MRDDTKEEQIEDDVDRNVRQCFVLKLIDPMGSANCVVSKRS